MEHKKGWHYKSQCICVKSFYNTNYYKLFDYYYFYFYVYIYFQYENLLGIRKDSTILNIFYHILISYFQKCICKRDNWTGKLFILFFTRSKILASSKCYFKPKACSNAEHLL